MSGESEEVAQAFRILNKTRQAGFDANPISLGEITHYIELFGYPWFGLDIFVELIVGMDHVFREVTKPKEDEKDKDKKGKPGSG